MTGRSRCSVQRDPGAARGDVPGTQFGTAATAGTAAGPRRGNLRLGPADAPRIRRCTMPNDHDRLPATLEWILVGLMLLSAML